MSKGERDGRKCDVYRAVSPGTKYQWGRDGSVPLWKAQPELQAQLLWGVVKRDLGAEAGEDVMFSVSLLSPVPHL